MDESFSNLTLPVFSIEHAREFRREVELWSLISTLPEDKQALALTYNLPHEVKVKVLCEFSVLNDLKSSRGLNRLLDFLEATYKNKALYSQFTVYASSLECEQENESMGDYINRFEEKWKKTEHLNKDLTATFRLIRGSYLSAKDKERVLDELEEDADQPGLFERAKEILLNWSHHKKIKFSASLQGEDREAELTGMLDLPNEILKKIFFLMETRDILSFGAVCKKLRNLMEEYSPWRLLAPSPISFNHQTSLLNHVARCRNLLELQLPSRKDVTDFHGLYAQVAASCVNLQSLTVTVFDRHDLDYLAFLFDSCTNIRNLKLRSSELVLIDLRSLKMIGNRLPHLTHLEISDNFMDPSELTYISQKFRNLKLLVLQVYGNSDAESNEAIRLIGERCTCLEVLKLQGFYVNAFSLESIRENCSNLKTFLLSPDKDILPSDMRAFGKKCQKLEELHLHIGDIDNLTVSRGLYGMLEDLPNLSRLYLYEDKRSQFPLPLLEPLAEKCTRLKELALLLYSDENQIAASLRAYLQSASSNFLEKFVLRYNTETSVKSLKDIGKSCPNLKVLQLGKVSMSELDFLYILRGCSKLEGLVLADMNMNNWSCDVGKFCPNLKTLSIDTLNETFVISFIKNCRKLEKLDITELAVNFNDIGKDLENLEHLEILRIYSVCVDVDEVADIFSACLRLRRIYINCEREEIQQLRSLLKRPIIVDGFRELTIYDSENSWTSSYLQNFGSYASTFLMGG